MVRYINYGRQNDLSCDTPSNDNTALDFFQMQRAAIAELTRALDA